MKNKTEGEMIMTCRNALAQMKNQGINLKYNVLDNEILALYCFKSKAINMTFQLVPEDNHRCNLAEKAIQT